jgi:hypothetical protein
MLIPIDAAAKLKEEGGTRQVGRFNFHGNRISFNSATALLTPSTFANTNLKVKHLCGRRKTLKASCSSYL